MTRRAQRVSPYVIDQKSHCVLPGILPATKSLKWKEGENSKLSCDSTLLIHCIKVIAAHQNSRKFYILIFIISIKRKNEEEDRLPCLISVWLSGKKSWRQVMKDSPSLSSPVLPRKPSASPALREAGKELREFILLPGVQYQLRLFVLPQPTMISP